MDRREPSLPIPYTPQNNQPPSHAIILRSSCDPCSISKVKCDQERPVCRRCTLSGATCVYGISRKHGPSSLHSRGGRRKTSLKTKSTASIPQVPRPPQTFVNSQLPMETDFYADNSTFDESANLNVEDCFSNFQEVEPWESSSSSHHEFGVLGTAIGGSWDSMLGFSPKALSHQSPIDPSGDVLNHQSPDQRQCQIPSCYSVASSTLNDLNRKHYPTSIDLPEFKSFIFSEVQEVTSQVSSLDTILRYNKTAVKNIALLLDCSCAHDPHLAMLYSSIMCKTLLWYRRAVNSQDSSPIQCTRISNAQTLPTPSSDTSDFTVASMHITAGGFDLDANDQKALSTFLLLSELEKAGLVIDKMASMFNRASGSCNEKTNDIYGMLGGWLKTELARTMREIQG